MIRGTLEGLGAELAAKKVTGSDIADLKVLNQRLANTAEVAERLAIDRDFHTRICEITGSPVLLMQIKLLWRTLENGQPVDVDTDEWIAEHEEIIRALSEGDCSEARAATNDHVLHGFKAYAPPEE